jgi:hypothetical protein
MKLIAEIAIGYFFGMVLWEFAGFAIARAGRWAVRQAAEQIKARTEVAQ